MYWPIDTPRLYAVNSTRTSSHPVYLSHDNSPSLSLGAETFPASSSNAQLKASSNNHDDLQPPPTPLTPSAPTVQSVENDGRLWSSQSPAKDSATPLGLPADDPLLALRVSRAGHLFAVITSTSVTVWQTKPTVVLAVVVRSETSLLSYGKNIDLLLRPDSAILVVQTDLGFLITYSLATDGESCVYKSHFPNYHNLHRRKQSQAGINPALQPDQFLWGPGEGFGVRDVSIRFRMVIKIDAGIESALALDDELVVATRKPAAVQCIRWTPDETGNQTRTEVLSRMNWIEKKTSIVGMTYDRPMNLATWITSDGRALAVQRQPQARRKGASVQDPEPQKLFHGHCFHVPQGSQGVARMAVINARFSLIAVACSDGTMHVYSVKDYAGNIVHSHTQRSPVSTSVSGAFTSLSYSPDGYCLFVGFEKGWATWSMFGKLGSHSFAAEDNVISRNGESWLQGVVGTAWIGGGSELLLISPKTECVWSLDFARSAVTGCYSDANVSRTVLQTPTTVMIYQGYDLPDLTSISAEPFLWHVTKVPVSYLLNQWPIRQTVVSPDGRYLAVAGRRGLAHYSVNRARWKTFANVSMENDFQVRGGMCWYQHVLVAAIESNRSFEIRLVPREDTLDRTQDHHIYHLPAPVVLVTISGEDSLLVYTYENTLYHFIFTPWATSVRLVQVGQIAFHGIVRSPARVRGLSWIVPQNQLLGGDPSQDVAVASVVFLVDGKIVLLSPSLSETGQLKYDMRVLAQNVEFFASRRNKALLDNSHPNSHDVAEYQTLTLADSLWVFDGVEIKAWMSIEKILTATSAEKGGELPTPVSIPVDFYPLSVVLGKGIILGVESDLVQRRDVSFSYFHFAIRTHLVLPDVLRFYLHQNLTAEAASIAEQYKDLEYFPHALEILLHRVLDDEADTSPETEHAILPRVISILSASKDYLDVILRCTRKTEVRQWKTLFAYLPPAQELFEQSLQQGSLKTAGGYLIILHTLETLGTSADHSVRVLSRAIEAGDWALCKELARFLAAMDESGKTLLEAMAMASKKIDKGPSSLGERLMSSPGIYGRNGWDPNYTVRRDGAASEVAFASDISGTSFLARLSNGAGSSGDV